MVKDLTLWSSNKTDLSLQVFFFAFPLLQCHPHNYTNINSDIIQGADGDTSASHCGRGCSRPYGRRRSHYRAVYDTPIQPYLWATRWTFYWKACFFFLKTSGRSATHGTEFSWWGTCPAIRWSRHSRLLKASKKEAYRDSCRVGAYGGFHPPDLQALANSLHPSYSEASLPTHCFNSPSKTK
jgi:hypothetical protein